MYSLINRYAIAIVDAITRQHVTDYEWLFAHLNEINSPAYRKNFRKFWAMNPARLSAEFYDTFFDILSTVGDHNRSLNQVCHSLYACSTRRNGMKTLQFSFATKLLHMGNPQLPVYDSQVAHIYSFRTPSSKESLEQRIGDFVTFHEFLVREYKRVLEERLLETAINEFRDKLRPQHFTDVKVIDSLVWKTAGLISKGALANGRTADC